MVGTGRPRIDRRTAGNVLSALASALGIAGGFWTWLGPTGTRCISSGDGALDCHRVAILSATPWPVKVAVLLATVGFALVPFAGRHRRVVPLVWATVLIGFYAVSFGVDLSMLPAALVSIAAGSMIQGPPRTKTVG